MVALNTLYLETDTVLTIRELETSSDVDKDYKDFYKRRVKG